MGPVQVITSIIGGAGGLAGLVLLGRFLWDIWAHREERQAERQAAEERGVDAAFLRLERAADRLESDVVRLTASDESNRGRIEKLEDANRALAEENRTFRTVVIGVMNRLRRKPPDSPEAILAFILEHLPFLGKDPS